MGSPLCISAHHNCNCTEPCVPPAAQVLLAPTLPLIMRPMMQIAWDRALLRAQEHAEDMEGDLNDW